MKILRIAASLSILLLLCCSTIISSSASANTDTEKGNMVYADKELQDEIYAAVNSPSCNFWLTLQKYNLTIVKESIMPVYTISPMDYAETGELVLKRTNSDYAVKVITANGEHAANTTIRITEQTVRSIGTTETSAGGFEGFMGADPQSCSYADHAERIREALNRSDFVPVENVRFFRSEYPVSFTGFIVFDDDEFYLFPIGNVVRSTDGKDISEVFYMTASDLRILGENQRYEMLQVNALKEAWDKTHPAEEWSYVGGGSNIPGLSVRVDHPEVKNINNIFEYLNIPETFSGNEPVGIPASIRFSEQNPAVENTYTAVIVGSVICAVCLAIVIPVSVIRRKKKASKAAP